MRLFSVGSVSFPPPLSSSTVALPLQTISLKVLFCSLALLVLPLSSYAPCIQSSSSPCIHSSSLGIKDGSWLLEKTCFISKILTFFSFFFGD
ncbi:uncharacterized protein DS421_16g555240 [Arachis hypogaea]|nr:uncharacterized protein DS421_16g555240 [Arachis hypogaea]